MSFIETDGRFPRFLTRAQKWAITNESAPSSSKKWLSTDTRSTRRTSASTSAKMLSAPVVAALPRSSISIDSAAARRTHGHGTRPPRLSDKRCSCPLATASSYTHLPNAKVENPHAERRENDRTTHDSLSSCNHDVGRGGESCEGRAAQKPAS